MQMQHRCRRVLCTDAGALCAVFVFLRPVSEKRRRRAVGSGATHAYISLHRIARPTHTAHRAPVAPIDSHQGRGEGRQSHAAEGWQGPDATSITPPCALSTTAAC